MALNKEQAARLKALEEVEAEESNPQMARLGQEQQRREDEGVDPAQDMQDSQDQVGGVVDALKEEGGRIIDDPMGAAEAAGRGALSGVTMDFDDEGGGAFLAMVAKLQGDTRPKEIIYREKRDEIRAKKLEMRESFPATSFLSEAVIGGGVVGLKVARLMGNSKRAALASGVVEGGITGLGMSEADFAKDGVTSKLLFDVGIGGGFGGLIGTGIAARRGIIPTEIQGEAASRTLRSKELGEIGKKEFLKDFGNPKDIAQYMHYDLGGFSNKDVIFDVNKVKFVPANLGTKIMPESMATQMDAGQYYHRNKKAISMAGEERDSLISRVTGPDDELVSSGAITKGESEMYISPKHFDAKERYLADHDIDLNTILSKNKDDVVPFVDIDGGRHIGNVRLVDQSDGSRIIIGTSAVDVGKKKKALREFELPLPPVERDDIQTAISLKMNEIAEDVRFRGQTDQATMLANAVEIFDGFKNAIRGGVHLTELNNIKKQLQSNVADFDGLGGVLDSSAKTKKEVWGVLQRQINALIEERIEKSSGRSEADRFLKLNEAMRNMIEVNKYHQMSMAPKGALAQNMAFTPFVSKIGATVKIGQTLFNNMAVTMNRSRAYWSDMLNHFKNASVFKIPGSSKSVWDARESVYVKLALANPEMAGWFEKNVLNEDSSVAQSNISKTFPQLFEDPSMMGAFEDSIAFDDIVTDPVKKSMISQQIHKREDLGIIERAELINEFHRTGKIPDVLNPNKG